MQANANAEQRRLAAHLRPLAVKQHLEARGWRAVSGVRGRLWVYQHPVESLRQVQVPMEPEDPAFAEAMLDAVARMAELGGRSLDDTLADLQHPDADQVRFRIDSAATRTGDVPIGEDVALREGARRALLSAAKSVVQPSRHHARLSGNQVDAFINACRTGQAERGSYVLRVICPLYAVDDAPMLQGSDPFTRAVTTLLLRAVQRLVCAIESSDLDEMLHEDAAAPIISSNLCAALMRMRPDTDDGLLELRPTWATVPQVAPPTEVAERVVVRADYFPLIERVYQRLRPTADETREEAFVGTVETLNGEVGDDGRRYGEVIVALLDHDGEVLPTRLHLNADQYAEAINAHESSTAYVRVTGKLTRGIRISRLDAVRDFRLVRND